MNKVTVVFHKSLLKYTNGVKKVEMTPDAIYFLFLNSINLFPELEKIAKKTAFNNQEDFVLIHKGKCLTKEDVLFPAKSGETYYIVPVFYGADPTIATSMFYAFLVSFVLTSGISLVQGADPITALKRGFVSGVFSAIGAYGFAQLGTPILGEAIAGPAGLGATAIQPTMFSYLAYGTSLALGSVVANVVAPIRPRRNNTDSVDAEVRRNNDAFDSIANTNTTRTPIALNYGMIRVGGNFINIDVDTINHTKDDVIKVVDYV